MQKSRIMKRGGFRVMAILLTLVMLIGAIPAAAKTTKRTEVPSKKKLYAEMKKSVAETIVFATDKEVSYTFSSKYNATSKNKKLVIDAPNATIVNKAKFKVVTIVNAKSYAEAGDQNTMYVKDPDAEIIVAKKAKVKKITFDTKSADLELRNNSKVGKIVFREKNAKVTVSAGKSAEADITLTKKTSLSVTGSQDSDINIDVEAAKSTVYAHIPVDIEVEKNSKIVLLEGSEKTVLETSNPEVKVNLVVKSKETPTVIFNGQIVATPVPTNEPTPTVAPTSTPTPTETPTPTPTPSSGNGGSGAIVTAAPVTSAPTQAPTQAPTEAPTAAPTYEPRYSGIWYAYSSIDDEARYEVDEFNERGRVVKDGRIYSGTDRGYFYYYFYDADGRLSKQLSADGSYIEYVYGNGTDFIVKRTSKDIDDIATRIETEVLVDNNVVKTTVADGKGNTICYYTLTSFDDGTSERVYESKNGTKLTVEKSKKINNRYCTILSASVDESRGFYNYLDENTYDESTGRRTISKTSWYDSYGKKYSSNSTEYEYYEDGLEKKRTHKDANGRIDSSIAYEYYDNGLMKKRTESGRDDKVLSYDVYIYAENKDTTQHFDAKDTLLSYEVYDYVDNGYTATYYDGDGKVRSYTVYEYNDADGTSKITYKDAEAKVVRIESYAHDDRDRNTKYLVQDGQGNTKYSFECVYNDDTHSFAATYVEDGKTKKLEAGYDTATDIMTVSYKDGETETKSVVKEFSKYGMQMRVKTNGEISFDRNSKGKIVKETSEEYKWDSEKQEYSYVDVVKTYSYDETTGKVSSETETVSGTVRRIVNYSYNEDGYLVKKTISNNSEYNNYSYVEEEYTYYADDLLNPTTKSSSYKTKDGYSYKYEYNEKGLNTLYESYRQKELSYKYTNVYDGNTRTYTSYNSNGEATWITIYTYADGHLSDNEEYLVSRVEKTGDGTVIDTYEYTLDDAGRTIQKVSKDSTGAIVFTEFCEYYEDGVRKSVIQKDSDNKITYEETFNEWGDTLTLKNYSDGQVYSEYEYSYDEYGNILGHTYKYGDTVEEYEYIEGIRRELLVKRTIGGNVAVENVYEDLDGVLTKHNKETSGSGEATLSLEAAYYATNTTSNNYYERYDRVINVTSDMPASAGGIKFEIKRDADNDDRITEINSTYNGALIEFLNIKYEYTGDRNTKTYIKRKGQEEIFDEYGNRIETE